MARKRFGQNFLIDNFVIDNIISAIDAEPKQDIVEIGPGLGALTTKLIKSGANIDAIEIDRDLVSSLEALTTKKFTVHNADILDFDLRTLKKKNLRIVGNLPYNISTPLLFKLFGCIDLVKDMHFMLQREVAIRLTAAPNNKDYGRLSVMAQYFCDMEIILDVPPSSFDPAPKVDSSVIRFIPKNNVQVTDLSIMQRIVTAAFNQRRKTISNSMKGLLTSEDLLQLNINPKLRAENLSLADYTKLTNYLIGKK